MQYNQRTILIVDDCLEDREIYRYYLQGDNQHTYKILQAETGLEGLALCKQELPDAILLDYMLPDIDGLEFLSELRSCLDSNHLSVLMLTSQGDEEVAVAAMKSGVADYLVKNKITAESLRLVVNYATENTRLQRLLEKSQQRFRTSIENMHDCFGIYTSVRDCSGKIVDFTIDYMNAAACADSCMSADELIIGQRLSQSRLCFWQNELFEDCCYVVETGKSLVKELSTLTDTCKNGHFTKIFDFSIAKLDDGIVVCWRDITQRKQVEEELRQAKAQLEQRVRERTAELATKQKLLSEFFNAAAITGIGLGIFDQYKRCLTLNQVLADMISVSAEYIGKTLDEMIPFALASSLNSLFDRVITTRKPIVNQEIQGAILTHPGVQRDWLINFFPTLADDGSVSEIGIIVFEVTERKQVEEALRQSEAEFRSLSERSPMGIFRTDVQGKCTYTNPQYQNICDCTFEESLGDGWVNLLHPEDKALCLAQWTAAVSEIQQYAAELRYKRKDGSIRYCRVQAAPMFTITGELIGHVGTVEDISESRAIAQMKNEFISVVSHELRTPLTSLCGSLGLLASGIYDENPKKSKRMLQVAADSVTRLARLVNDILDLERLQSGKVTLTQQRCDVVALLLQSTEAMFIEAEQNNINLCVIPTSLQAHVWADPDAIIQTLTNLLSNAIKFSEAGTTIWLDAKIYRGDTEHELSLSSSPSPHLSSFPCSSYVLFSVKDQGRGIPGDKLETIFGQFQQVDASDSRQKGGTGLGLAICRNIIQQHGGHIWVESVLGKGSTFYFTLPLPPDS